MDALACDLADLPGPAAVVIDDAQFAETSQRTLALLAQHLAGHVRLLVASQHNPVFSTSRLRLAGVITELRAGDLAFTQVEVEQLLELAGLGREPVDGRRLRSLTEGWPAGLQMAMLAMRAGGDPREVIDAFAATTRETSDYLASEVMSRLPPGLAASRRRSASWRSSTPGSARRSAAGRTPAGCWTGWLRMTCSSTRSTARASGSGCTRCSRRSCGRG